MSSKRKSKGAYMISAVAEMYEIHSSEAKPELAAKDPLIM
jgi:hypothetical protein